MEYSFILRFGPLNLHPVQLPGCHGPAQSGQTPDFDYGPFVNLHAQHSKWLSFSIVWHWGFTSNVNVQTRRGYLGWWLNAVGAPTPSFVQECDCELWHPSIKWTLSSTGQIPEGCTLLIQFPIPTGVKWGWENHSYLHYPSIQSLQFNFYFANESQVFRGGFKTQPPVDRRFRPVPGGCHCLEQ